MNRVAWSSMMVVGAMALLLLSACSTGSSSDERVAPAPDPVASSVVASLDPGEDASPLDLSDEDLGTLARAVPGPSPLDELFAGLEAEWLPYDEAQEVVAACMESEGFDYVPFNPSGQIDVPEELTDEYVVNATVGYGISTFLGREPILLSSGGLVDLNAEIYRSLTDEEREIYDEQIDVCQIEAGLVIPDDQIDQYEIVWTELEGLRQEVDDQIEARPAVVEARAAWAGCMAEAGLDYANRDEIYTELQRDTQALMAANPALRAGALADDLDTEQQQRLAELQTRERTIAQADLLCRAELDQVLWAARLEIERGIIADEGARIDRLIIAMAELANV